MGKLKENNVAVKTEVTFKERLWVVIPVTLLIGLISTLVYNHHAEFSWNGFVGGFNQEFLIFFSIGIFAQLVDGTLGMGYGATSTSFLLAYGIPPAISSTGVHVAEMFTTGASAISHHRFGNINKKLVKHLLIPGVLGSITGAYLLSDVIDGDAIKPFIAVYMIALAVIIIRKAMQKNIIKKKTKRLGILASFGGFMDAVGGGGWGPIVTSTLLGRGRNPRYTIGSVNAAEFAVSFASGITFMIFGGIQGWQVIIGLILGGVIAAPIAALLVNKIKRQPMMILVGVLIIILSLRTLSKLL
ncbi:sulfite exporter TauE/SafE family protein [Flavobacterium gawalongense]|uniref:Probable membrane transporter protein n=1 Tax=Flavobacterium gawalongense TaxID=2594432 RepID=A0A553BUG9_9FLAO|nr:sulfite exporter TauE/SafE family protein [Flavobacterium gawalongense]TRX02406.1 sulfite exporter TauE/SafE family protein [Flavobacterium gawalongense]TRX07765.1 sulfite exporter TauE/SafE family protein [Flavobacterium gawalongense]TRX11893.1 sulfite exporter TauE/SafE family protein [Flavobacterium gawalongense]TRX13073.1 sulfite exporter TauE/SafE family protein [Flavobacterium gawalongense]TRX30958.1 sulfite exporter TauE/SafE family protein [Flavobacterium gawalongense]